MPDFADIGADYTDRWLEGVIDEHRHQLSRAPTFEAGRCRNCETKTDDGRSYCDDACRDDHQSRIAADKRNCKYRGG